MQDSSALDSRVTQPELRNSPTSLAVAAAAAFCVYFCMYAFRKPFTAGVYEGQLLFGIGLKSLLVISQLVGYTLSKFIGIRVIAEMPSSKRAMGIVGLIVFAELALVGFAILPVWLKPIMMFLNGLPLGLVFGLTLSYLEGRKQTEALSAVLCASFIMSSGVVKSVGRWLIESWGVSEFTMPMLAGFLFLPPFFIAVWVLQLTPPPDKTDRFLRKERIEMRRPERSAFLRAYWPGLSCLIFVYIALTIARTLRDDFGVEIWRDMGVTEMPSVFATSETIVAVFATILNAFAILITRNVTAFRMTVALMCLALTLIIAATVAQYSSQLSPYAFMVATGIGLYIPYVAFHTTLFERLIASSKLPGNLGFLMYLADSIGYLGYAIVMLFQGSIKELQEILPIFRVLLVVLSLLSLVALVAALLYFQRILNTSEESYGNG